ncbi:exodeoxyribonuclease VII large subunit [Candidatus Saccharibacteria bacterium]|nr:exodeoxyribonuclease VII large subunit [Candidatus Saccharibacteria bacterium]
MEGVVLAPADFVALVNQTLEYAYPLVTVEGELSNFRVSKNRWVYFDLQDEQASVKFFGTVYNLPGPLEDGLKIRVIGAPRLHPRFGFSVNIVSISAVGEGSIKKAAQLLQAKLEKEGLFGIERKRQLPLIPRKVGLITAAKSAAYSDFIKILNERWGGVEVSLADVYVQGQQAPLQLVAAIEHFNNLPALPDVLVITRGGGSAEDLAAFSDERVVRSVAASRIPTLVAIGHEVDISLAELAADVRASTPSNAVQLMVPDKSTHLQSIAGIRLSLGSSLNTMLENQAQQNRVNLQSISSAVNNYLEAQNTELQANRKLAVLFDPRAALKRGYAIVSLKDRHLSSVNNANSGDELSVQLSDGRINSKVTKIIKGA